MKTRYYLMLIATILVTLAGIITLIPSSYGFDNNFLGYESLCPFAPFSSLICFLILGIICKIRSKYRLYVYN